MQSPANVLTKVLVGNDDRPGAIIGAWALAFMTAALLTILLLRQIWDPDIFWQLKLGEMILAHGGPIGREPFSAPHLGEPLPAVAWLGQALMAEIRFLAGWTGLRIFDALCWLGGFLLVAAASRRNGSSPAGLIVALALAFWIAFPTASIRPQTFAVLGFGAVLATLQRDWKPWRMTWIALPLLVLWQNLHPSVSVAAVVFGTYAAVDWARWLRKQGAAPWETSLLALIAAAAMFATPDGWSILRVSADNAAASTAMGVTEWLPLWDPRAAGSLPSFLLASGILAALVAFRWRGIEPRELALAVVFLTMTACANRFVLFWAMALIPVIARSLTAAPTSAPAAQPPRMGLQTPLLLLAAAVATPLQYPTQFSPGLALDAIRQLHDRGISGVIFAHAPWGGPLIDAGYPRWRVAYDGRFYRYTPAEWEFYRAIDQDKVPLAEVERRYHPAAFVLDPQWQTALIAELRRAPGWRQVAADDVAVVFERAR